jgi:hypothetical protein
MNMEHFVTISDLVKELKGAGAFELNQRERRIVRPVVVEARPRGPAKSATLGGKG